MIERRPTRQVTVGDDRVGYVKIGGDAPVSVQTMTAGYTHDVAATVTEINRLAAAGADIVRVAVPERKDTEALAEILPQVRVPIVADVHFHFERALEAVEAGVHKIRLNPGNISDRDQVEEVIAACKERNLPIRVGVNEGSIVERKDKQKRMKELGGVFSEHQHGQPSPQACPLRKDHVLEGLRQIGTAPFPEPGIGPVDLEAAGDHPEDEHALEPVRDPHDPVMTARRALGAHRSLLDLSDRMPYLRTVSGGPDCASAPLGARGIRKIRPRTRKDKARRPPPKRSGPPGGGSPRVAPDDAWTGARRAYIPPVPSTDRSGRRTTMKVSYASKVPWSPSMRLVASSSP